MSHLLTAVLVAVGVVVAIFVILWLSIRRMPFIGGKLKSYERDVRDKVQPGYEKEEDASLPGRKTRNRYGIFGRKKLDK